MRRLLVIVAVLLVSLSSFGQEILFDELVEAGGLKCYPVKGDMTRWYYLPDEPHLVADEDGRPQFSFLVYARPERSGGEGITRAAGGGVAHFLVAYDVAEDRVRRAASELQRVKPGAVLVGPVSYTDGSFALVTAVTDPQAGMSRRVAGVGSAPVMAGHKAAVSMHLTPLGASLLWESFHQATPDISVNFEMSVSGYLNPVEAKMTIDYEKVHKTMQAQVAARYGFFAAEVDALVQSMRDNGAITVELTGAPPSQWDAIQKMGLELARNHLFENQGGTGLASLAAMQQKSSPMDQMWKRYGDEWKKKASRLQWPPESPPRQPAWISGHPLTVFAVAAVSIASPDSVTDSEKRAVQAMSDAMGLESRGKYLEAARKNEEALIEAFIPVQYWHIARCYLKAGNTTEALPYLDRYVAKSVLALHSPSVKSARKAITDFSPGSQSTTDLLTLVITYAKEIKVAAKVDDDQFKGIEATATASARANAAAQPTIPNADRNTTPPDIAALRATIENAERNYRQGRFAEAARTYLHLTSTFSEGDANRLLGWNAGICELKAGKPETALIFFEHYVNEDKGLSGSPAIKGAKDALGAAPRAASAEVMKPLVTDLVLAIQASEKAGFGKPPAPSSADTKGLTITRLMLETPVESGVEVRAELRPLLGSMDRKHVEAISRGKDLYDQKKYSDALAVFETAWKQFRQPEVRWNIALCHLMLGQRDRALTALDEFFSWGKRSSLKQHAAVKEALDAIKKADATIPSEQRRKLADQLTDAYQKAAAGKVPTADMKAYDAIRVGRPAAAAAEKKPAVPAAKDSVTPGVSPKVTAKSPTKTVTPKVTPTPKAETPYGVMVSFKFRRLERTGKFTLNFKQWLRTQRPVRFAENLGDLTGWLDEPSVFRRVNLDDPVFRQREIPVSVDVAGEEAFAAMLNAVTVQLRKVHASGRETVDEVTVQRQDFASGQPMTLLYGWDGDDDRERWLEYDYRVRWNYVGGPEIQGEWQRTSAGAQVLAPPLRPRELILEADPGFLEEQGVRDVVVEVSYDAAGTERRVHATVRTQAETGEQRLVLYQDPQQPEYRYSFTWRLRGGQRVSAGPFTDTADYVYLDEIPQE